MVRPVSILAPRSQFRWFCGDPGLGSGVCRKCPDGTRCSGFPNLPSVCAASVSCPHWAAASTTAGAIGSDDDSVVHRNGSGEPVNSRNPFFDGSFVCGTGGSFCNVCSLGTHLQRLLLGSLAPAMPAPATRTVAVTAISARTATIWATTPPAASIRPAPGAPPPPPPAPRPQARVALTTAPAAATPAGPANRATRRVPAASTAKPARPVAASGSARATAPARSATTTTIDRELRL